jgi:hypothetical protein
MRHLYTHRQHKAPCILRQFCTFQLLHRKTGMALVQSSCASVAFSTSFLLLTLATPSFIKWRTKIAGHLAAFLHLDFIVQFLQPFSLNISRVTQLEKEIVINVKIIVFISPSGRSIKKSIHNKIKKTV